MSKPSARPGPRSFTPGYHRRNVGGGNVLKAVTRAKRRFPRTLTWQPGLTAKPAVFRAARRKALQQLVEVVDELQEQDVDLVTPQGPVGHRDTAEGSYEREAA